jgi:hypothetical protein
MFMALPNNFGLAVAQLSPHPSKSSPKLLSIQFIHMAVHVVQVLFPLRVGFAILPAGYLYYFTTCGAPPLVQYVVWSTSGH